MKIYVLYTDEDSVTPLLKEYGIENKICSKSSKIVIKPNLVTPSDPSYGATTHTGIIIGLIEYLRGMGFENITISESAWVGSSTSEAFDRLGYRRISEKYSVKLVDNKKDEYRIITSHGIRMEISSTCLEADYLINVPVLKGHCQTGMTAAMKNLKGCLSDRSKREFHSLGLFKPIAALNDALRPNLTIVDSICGDLDFEEGGNPVDTGMIYMGENPVTLDAYGASLMGYAPEDIEYIRIASSYGLGGITENDYDVIELNKPVKKRAMPTGMVKELSSYTDERDACSACFASLIRALKIMSDNKSISKLSGMKVSCGRAFRGKKCEIGSGACATGTLIHIPGCPPPAFDIVRALEDKL